MSIQTFDMVDVGLPSAALVAIIEKHKLNREQANFVMLYVQYDMAGRSRTRRHELVKAAGYKTRDPRRAYGQLMALPKILAAIRDFYDDRAKKTTMTAAQVTRELCKMAVSNITDFVRIDNEGMPQIDMSDVDDEQMATIKSIKTKRVTTTVGRGDDAYDVVIDTAELVMHDKHKALTTLGRYMRLEPSLQDDKPPEQSDKIPPRELAMNIMTAIASMVEEVKQKEPIDVTPNQEVEAKAPRNSDEAHVSEVKKPTTRGPAKSKKLGKPSTPRRRMRPTVD